MRDLANPANRSLECRVNYILSWLSYRVVYAVHILKTDFWTLFQRLHNSTAFRNEHGEITQGLR
jgi:hypothetical protein